MTQVSQTPTPPGEPNWHPEHGPLVPITLTLTLETVAHLMELAAMEGRSPSHFVALLVSDEATSRDISRRDRLDCRWLPNPGRDAWGYQSPRDVRFTQDGERPWQVRMEAYQEDVARWIAGGRQGVRPFWIETSAPDMTGQTEEEAL